MEAHLKQQIAELLRTQGIGVLATSFEGHPYTTLVAFAATDDLMDIFFATHRATRKYANLSRDARVTLLIDNRSNRARDFRDAVALTALGSAGEVAQEHRAELKQFFLTKHPQLREFVLAPTCALCRISVWRYSLVRRFQDVLELVFDEADTAS
jgi:nitroimidazol reductase NimA-like FMN-containing flavoprotein (pyridoxamine 5'-phosphate oxidase superfamily)